MGRVGATAFSWFVKKGDKMKIDWESQNMAWRIYFQVDWGGLCMALVIAGVDISFHILNLRDIVYQDDSEFIKKARGEK